MHRASLARRLHQRTLHCELLEPRIVLAADDLISVGRFLSATSTDQLLQGQLTISYSVFNQQEAPVYGTLLTTTLQPGVVVQDTSLPVSQNGQELSWSLGELAPFAWTTVELTVSFVNAVPLQIDSGARAFGIVNARSVSDSAPAATLRTGSIDPTLLASTPEFSIEDPFLRAIAAQYDHDPIQIFGFLRDQIGYESYVGSLRGARGALWSQAGNALDEASLGVALLRASGIPARYAIGTLDVVQAQQLLATMFPPTSRAIGDLPDAADLSDPLNDPRLIAEARQHAWIQYEVDGQFIDLDTTGLGLTLGQTWVAEEATFSEVPAARRHMTKIRLQAEVTNLATSLFGVPGQTLTTVLDESFATASLVGRSLTVGHLVTSRPLFGPIIGAVTHVYSPFLRLGEDAVGLASDLLTRGTDYQEFLTNFPFGSQVLTGVFLDVETTEPNGISETHSRALLDRIGVDVRRNGGRPDFSVDPTQTAALTPLDLVTINVSPSERPVRSLVAPGVADRSLGSFADFVDHFTASTPEAQAQLTNEANQRLADFLVSLQRGALAEFEVRAAAVGTALAGSHIVRAYLAKPRISLATSRLTAVNPTEGQLAVGIDLRESSHRVIAAPGQAKAAAVAFELMRGIHESIIEGQVLVANESPAQQEFSQPLNTVEIFRAAEAQGIGLTVLLPGDDRLLDALQISATAKARVMDALLAGKTVFVPERSVDIGGKVTIGWFEIVEETGETIGVLEDGSHGATELAFEYGFKLRQFNDPGVQFSIGFIAGFSRTGLLKTFALIAANWQIKSLPEPWTTLASTASDLKNAYGAARRILESWVKRDELQRFLLRNVHPAFRVGYEAGTLAAIAWTADPPVPSSLVDPLPTSGESRTSLTRSIAANASAGIVSADLTTPHLAAEGAFAASWSSNNRSTYQTRSVSAGQAQVLDAEGKAIGTGTISLNQDELLLVKVDGMVSHRVSGQGTIAFQAPATTGLGVDVRWTQYAAELTGDVVLVLTTDRLRLNGVSLPPATYRIRGSAIALTGAGQTSTPTFSGTARLDALAANTLSFGPAVGSLRLAGTTRDTGPGATFRNFRGAVTIEAGPAVDRVLIDGSAEHFLQLQQPVASVSVAHHESIELTFSILTSRSGVFRLNGFVPNGWTIEIDESTGDVRIGVKPGEKPGTYLLRFWARAEDQPDFVAAQNVLVTVEQSAPAVAVLVSEEPLLYVAKDGAQSPTVFRATVENQGSVADTFDLRAISLPPGFAARNSLESLTIPAGGRGITGINLIPTSPLPAPGTIANLQVEARSQTNPAVTAVTGLSFVVPEIRGLRLDVSRSSLSTIPGVPVDVMLTIESGANVPQDVTFEWTAEDGLMIDGLQAISLAPGATRTLPLKLTPASNIELNSVLSATVRARFDGREPILTTLAVVVVAPGVEAIAEASLAVQALGYEVIADRLEDLSQALTSLVQNTADPFAKGSAIASLDAVIGLMGRDATLSGFVDGLSTAREALDRATNQPEFSAALQLLEQSLTDFSATVTALADGRFNLHLLPTSQFAQPGVPAVFELRIQNLGRASSDYSIELSGLPAGITGTVSQPSITLGRGQVSRGLTITILPGADELFPFDFVAQVRLTNRPQIQQEAAGVVAVRRNFVSVVDVRADPPFTDRGSPVAVSVRLFSAINQTQQYRVQYRLIDANGLTVHTSASSDLRLTPQSSPVKFDLPQLSTTNLSDGQYTIQVQVTDTNGAAVPGGEGTGSLSIGSPVTGSVEVTPVDLATGTTTITNTLSITGSPTGAPFALVGQAPFAGANDAVRRGDLVYVAGSGGVGVFDVADESNPRLLRTVGGPATEVEVRGDFLYVLYATVSTRLAVYSLSDPAAPQFLGSTPDIPYNSARSLIVTETHAYVAFLQLCYFVSNFDVFNQTGGVLAIDITNPAQPVLEPVSPIFNTQGTNNDAIGEVGGCNASGGDFNVWTVIDADADTLLITSSTSTGTNTQVGVGRVRVIDVSDPASMTVVRDLEVPGTRHVFGLAIDGNRGLALGSQGGFNDFNPNLGFTGNSVLASLDLSDVRNPLLIDSQVTEQVAAYVGRPVSLGGGRFAASNPTDPAEPLLQLIDARMPENVLVSSIPVPALIGVLSSDGQFLYSASPNGLMVYRQDGDAGIPVRAEVDIPEGTGVTVVPGSFNIPPDEVIQGLDRQTLVWNTSLTTGTRVRALSWQSVVSGIGPAEVREVILPSKVKFAAGGQSGTIHLPAREVVGKRVITISPELRQVAPGGETSYLVTLRNPTSTAATYQLEAIGIPADWWRFAESTVTIPPLEERTIAMTLASDPFAAAAGYQFSVVARAPGVEDSAIAGVELVGLPFLPTIDPEARGVIASLERRETAVGQGGIATYRLRLTNTGSAPDQFALKINGLPPGFATTFRDLIVDVAPGRDNFQELPFVIQIPNSTPPGNVPFQLIASSVTSSAATQIDGAVSVLGAGLQVGFMNPTAQPGGSAVLQVTNLGRAVDTFDLRLAGPAALFARLRESNLTLPPGASALVEVDIGRVDDALTGTLQLQGIATSRTNPEASDSADAGLIIEGRSGLDAYLLPDTRLLDRPGATIVELRVENRGNLEDAFDISAAIQGALSFRFVGLNGELTNQAPVVRLPGLATGTVQIRVELADFGGGQIDFQIRSRSQPSIVDTATLKVSTRSADLVLTNRDQPDPASRGGLITYVLKIENRGPEAATGATLTDILPAGVTFVSAGSNDPSLVCSEANGIVTCQIPTLASGSVKTFSVVVRAPDSLGRLTNTASVSAAIIDPDESNNRDIVQTTDVVDLTTVLVIGAEAGIRSRPIVKVYGANRELISTFLAYATTFRGGVRVATGDLDGDQIPEIVTVPGRGHAPLVKVFDLQGREKLGFRINAFPNSMISGLSVAIGDVVGDSLNDIVVAPTRGSAEVRVFENRSGAGGNPFRATPDRSFLAYPKSFQGGVTLALADLNRRPDRKLDIITGSGAGMLGLVRAFDVATLAAKYSAFREFRASDVSGRGGVYVSAGRLDQDEVPDLIISAGQSGGSRVEIFNGATGAIIREFVAFEGASSKSTVRTVAKDLDGDGWVDAVFLAQGPDGRSKTIRRWQPLQARLVDFVFDDTADFGNGYYLG